MKDTKENTLNQHTALTTFFSKDNKYFNVGVEKAIFALLLKAQNEMRPRYREKIKEKIETVIKQGDIEDYIEFVYSGKDFDFSEVEMDYSKIHEITKEIYEYRKKDIYQMTGDERERKILLTNLEKDKTLKLGYSSQNKEIQKFSREEINDFFSELKEYCKDIVTHSYSDFKKIDLTALNKSIGSNQSELKRDLKKAAEITLSFNYINKKKLDIDITSSLIASVRFTKEKSQTWLQYQIPLEILDLLLLPKVYVPLEGVVVNKISGIYTFRLYGLLKDHIKRGEVEILKEELFNFFQLPKSYKNKSLLVKYFLEPALKEVYHISGIKSDFKFFPEKRGWETLKFYPKQVSKVQPTELKIVEAEEMYQEVDMKKIESAIGKSKRNIYVSKSWNKHTDNKIKKIIQLEGEDYAVKVLNALYENLKKEIDTTLVQYINGILKNLPNDVPKIKKIESPISVIEVKAVKKSEKIEDKEPVDIERKEEREDESKSESQENFDNILYNAFLQFPEEIKETYEKKAEEIYVEKVGSSPNLGHHKMIFNSIKKALIIEALKQSNG
ncbi:MAG: hypothetical protein ACRCTS_00890 [Fusobacteriaceae bacterium]